MDPRAQIALARHAPTGVTLKHYPDFGLFDLWGEIRKLPPIRWTDSEVEFVRATGTDDAVAGAPHELNNGVARPVAQNVGRKGVKRSAADRIPDESVTACHVETTLQNKGFSADSDDGRCATRTHNLRLVRAALWPIELIARFQARYHGQRGLQVRVRGPWMVCGEGHGVHPIKGGGRNRFASC